MHNKIYKLINKFIKAKPFFSLPNIDKQKTYANTLRSTIEQRVSGANNKINNDWVNNSNSLVNDILNKDPISFLDWDVIKKTMFHVAKEQEFFELKHSVFWKVYKDAFRESMVENPPKYPLYRSSSGNLIHHLYNLYQLYKHYPININQINRIVEFGGGYGSTCRVLYSMGYKQEYVIYDIPEFLALQRYFLSMLDIYKKCNIKLIDKITDNISNPDICIMTWSLSEVPIDLRNEFIKKLGRPKYFLIAYQKNFSEIDNIEYFRNFKKGYEGYEWSEYEIPHLRSNYYLIGKRND